MVNNSNRLQIERESEYKKEKENEKGCGCFSVPKPMWPSETGLKLLQKAAGLSAAEVPVELILWPESAALDRPTERIPLNLEKFRSFLRELSGLSPR